MHGGLLDHDPIKLKRIMVWIFRWSMIFSENRFPLFGIMLETEDAFASSTKSRKNAAPAGFFREVPIAC
jgi:hypothetical protein